MNSTEMSESVAYTTLGETKMKVESEAVKVSLFKKNKSCFYVMSIVSWRFEV